MRRFTGDFPAAARDLQEAVGTFRDDGDRLGVAEALTHLGAVRRMTGDYPGAARDLQEALDIARQIGSPDAEVTALNESGTLSRIRGDLGQSRSCHQQALDLARQLGIPLEEAHALAGLGRCAQAAGRTAEPKTGCGRRWRSCSGSARPKPPAYPTNWTRCGRRGGRNWPRRRGSARGPPAT